MPFQFQCPHCRQVLQGDASQASQVCHCPNCGQQFVIPQPVDPSRSAPPTSFDGTAPEPAHAGANQQVTSEGFPVVSPHVRSNPFASSGPKMYQIPCPKCPDNRMLETPAEMLGQEAICPHCGHQLRLREVDSIEYKQAQEEERDRKERRAGKAWLNWAIVIVILTIALVIGLIMAATPS